MKRLAKVLLFLGAAVLVVWAAKSFFAYVSSVPKEMAAAIIAGAATILVATLTVTIGRYFERKKELA